MTYEITYCYGGAVKGDKTYTVILDAESKKEAIAKLNEKYYYELILEIKELN